MTKELAEKLVELAHEEGIEAELYEDYSGRGMYGSTTTGIVIEDVGKLVGLAYQLGLENPDFEEVYELEVVDELRSLRWDSLGLQTIVY